MLKRLTSESQTNKDINGNKINNRPGRKNPNFEGMTEEEIIAYQKEILEQPDPVSGEGAESEDEDQPVVYEENDGDVN